MKYTPGPWEYVTEVEYMGAYPYSKCHRVKIGTETLTIGGHAYDWKGEGEIAAKARLIAAAPELLEACKYMSDVFGQLNCDSKQIGALVKAHHAIAKAEGRPEK